MVFKKLKCNIMRILITGAAGFIASHLCENLKSKGHEIYGIDNFNDYYDVKLKELNASDLAKQGIFIFRKDLRIEDNRGLIKLSEKCKEIIPIFILLNY